MTTELKKMSMLQKAVFEIKNNKQLEEKIIDPLIIATILGASIIAAATYHLSTKQTNYAGTASNSKIDKSNSYTKSLYKK